jgi:prepilin-type N-terminal cleavage/methylation domain-containing protein
VRAALKARLERCRREAGFTLIELLVASTMGVVVLGAVGSLVVSAMKDQPQISQRAQEISTTRWVLERLTREIRDGVRVDNATASSVSFQTYVRHSTCGGTGVLASSVPSIKCEVTYTCTTTYCSRTEAAPGVYTGTATKIFEGIGSSNVFSYVPNAAEATYIKVTLNMPNPDGASGGGTIVSDGASLRNATLSF